MRRPGLFTLASLAAFFATTAIAQVSSEPPQIGVAGWSEFIEGLRTLPDRLLAKLPAEQRADPQVQQEIGRLAVASLTAALLESLGSDGDHPAFVANHNLTLNYPQPNADTIYRISRVTPGGTYRLRGERGSLRQANIGQAGPMPGEPGGGALQAGTKRGVLDLNGLHVDKRGRFDVIISPVRPAGYSGDWWELASNTTRLLLRTVQADTSKERDPTISIERIDIPPQRARTPAATVEARLRDLPRAAALLPSIFVTSGARLRADGFLHKFKMVDAAQNGGLSGQVYYSSAYELADDEVLLITTRPPAKCLYRSIQLATEFEETIDWHNNQSSLNDMQAKPDRDGVLRIVISARDPGIPNWLDTSGYRRGIVAGRWMGCDSNPTPTIEKLPLAELRARLPADTPSVSPAQRETSIRDRREVLQQRPLW